PGAPTAQTGCSKSPTFSRRGAAAAGPAPKARSSSSANASLVTKLRDEALLRLLIGSPAQELGPMSDPLAGDVVEIHLADELRPQPRPDELLVRLPAARLGRGALARSVRLDQLDQLALLLGPEAQ